MAWRETRATWTRLVFFFLCVGLGVASIVVLRSLVQQVRAALTHEARNLIGADLVVQSGRPLSGAIAAKISAATTPAAGVTAATDLVETQTMAMPAAGDGAVKLVEVRAVEPAFPFYGQLEIEGGAPYSHALLEGHGVLVQPELLAALDVQVGGAIRLAGQVFHITGVIARDRIQRDGIAFGPRVYVDLADLRGTGVLGFGSRATYARLYRVPDAAATTALTDRLRSDLKGETVSVRSWQTFDDRVGENLTTAENYLSLVGFAVVVLGGLGVWSVTRVLVQQKIRSVAVLKCLGASSGSALAISLLQVLALAVSGSLLGLGLAAAALAALPASLLQPLGVSHVGLTASASAQGVAVGVLVSLLFALVPLLEIRDVKPLLLLRAHSSSSSRRRSWRSWTAGVATAAALVLVAMWQANSIRAGAFVSIGLAVAAAILYVASRLLVRLVRPLARSRRPAIRHATISLSRPGNQTRVIVMSVGLGCFFIVGVRATQTTLIHELSTQVGQSSPDFVLIDVQADQIARVRAVAERYARAPVRIVPLIRGRVVSVSGPGANLPNVEAVRARRGLGREFGLTFRDTLEANERITRGRFWTADAPAPNAPGGVDTEVSVEEQLLTQAGLSIGDLVTFDLAGVPLRARVTSARKVEWDESQNGGFVFVLRPAPAVSRAVQSYVGFVQIVDAAAARGAMQRDLVRAAPNVSVIDVRDVIASIRDVVDNITLGVTIVGLVTLGGGMLILVGAVALTKFERVYDAAIYRTLGASTRLIATMLATEYGLLGLLAGLLGAVGGLALSWVLSRYLFHIDWSPLPGLLALSVGAAVVVVCATGLAASADVLIRKPLAALRAEQ